MNVSAWAHRCFCQDVNDHVKFRKKRQHSHQKIFITDIGKKLAFIFLWNNYFFLYSEAVTCIFVTLSLRPTGAFYPLGIK